MRQFLLRREYFLCRQSKIAGAVNTPLVEVIIPLASRSIQRLKVATETLSSSICWDEAVSYSATMPFTNRAW